ncbi:MAG TPA: hypothetical protein VGX94_11235 [Terriglobia bacterium]|nr:hypothetical protein [Terriglobia bacterium]
MGAFRVHLENIASRGEVVNTLFEERLYGLVSIVYRIADALAEENVPYELVGGLAVLIYLEAADPSQSTLTRDVDVMIHRPDLDKVKIVAEQHGFHFRHAAGLDMLIAGPPEKARNAVHLVFSGEKVRESQSAPNPPICPDKRTLQGREVAVIALSDLIRMKLSAYRDKDRVHVRAMDAAGLINAQIERSLPGELQTRLRHIRETE